MVMMVPVALTHLVEQTAVSTRVSSAVSVALLFEGGTSS